jgi:hypothetical protein
MSFSLRALRPLGLIGVGVLATFGALSLTHLGPVQAQSPGVNLATLVARLNADEATITQLKGTPVPGPQGVKGDTGTPGVNGKDGINGLQGFKGDAGAQGVKGDTGAQGVKGDAGAQGVKGDTGAQGVKGDTGATGAGFTPAKIAVLNAMALSSDPSAGGTNTLLTISGVNVQIVNGLGSTETQNGLGNLVVGYNEPRGDGTDNRMGSHNIITGIYNNYASSGGIVGGHGNSLNGREEFAVGYFNTASGNQASVSGGYSNTASGDLSSVSGGYFNTASGYFASVSGGNRNTASGPYASVSGGYANAANAYFTSVSGGEYNTASGYAAMVSGGTSNTQSNANGWTGGSYHSP